MCGKRRLARQTLFFVKKMSVATPCTPLVSFLRICGKNVCEFQTRAKNVHCFFVPCFGGQKILSGPPRTVMNLIEYYFQFLIYFNCLFI